MEVLIKALLILKSRLFPIKLAIDDFKLFVYKIIFFGLITPGSLMYLNIYWSLLLGVLAVLAFIHGQVDSETEDLRITLIIFWSCYTFVCLVLSLPQ